MNYILNEETYINEILKNKVKPKDLSMGYFIILIGKKYFSKDQNYEYLSKKIKSLIPDFNIPNYQEYKYHDKITEVCKMLYGVNKKKTISPEFKNIDSIPIYQAEIEMINSLSSDREKKLMFTLYVIARYMNSNGWTNKKDSKGITEIFKLANITVSSATRNSMLHELYKKKYISFTKLVDNLNIKIELKPVGKILYNVKVFNNLGNQYLGNFKNGYKQCEKCGKVIKIKGKNHKYCSFCSNDMESIKLNERVKRHRETLKCNGF